MGIGGGHPTAPEDDRLRAVRQVSISSGAHCPPDPEGQSVRRAPYLLRSTRIFGNGL